MDSGMPFFLALPPNKGKRRLCINVKAIAWVVFDDSKDSLIVYVGYIGDSTGEQQDMLRDEQAQCFLGWYDAHRMASIRSQGNNPCQAL